ncbi:MAG: hypothetical protein F6K41_02615 [Symploca sp. SIO3E6]|nr:hypothetical protein [Caldora sp. SIO3E6]
MSVHYADAVGDRLHQNLQTTKIRSVTVQGAECGLKLYLISSSVECLHFGCNKAGGRRLRGRREERRLQGRREL